MIVTRGLNSNLVVTRGYGLEYTPPVPPPVIVTEVDDGKYNDPLLTASLKVLENQDGVSVLLKHKVEEPKKVLKKEVPKVKEKEVLPEKEDKTDLKVKVNLKPIERLFKKPLPVSKVEKVLDKPKPIQIVIDKGRVLEKPVIKEEVIKNNIVSFDILENKDGAIFKTEVGYSLSKEDEEIVSILSLIL